MVFAKMFRNMIKFSVLLALYCMPLHTQACSSRTVPKPRPSVSSSSISATALPPSTTIGLTTTIMTTTTTTTTTTTPRPNITFPTYKCPDTYDAWYCLNEATCFSVKIGDSIMYNCECAIGFMGPRCEYKELDGSYLPKRPRPMLEKASIASGATCALLFMLFACLTLYLRYGQKPKSFEDDEYDEYDVDVIGMGVKVGNNRREHCCGCCGGGVGMGSNDTDLLVAGNKYRQQFPTLSFTFRRSAKL